MRSVDGMILTGPTLYQGHSVHHSAHNGRPGIEHGTPRNGAGD